MNNYFYGDIITNLRSRRKALALELEQVEAAIAALEGLEALGGPAAFHKPAVRVSEAAATVQSPNRPGVGLSLFEAVKAHMIKAHCPQSTREVIDGVRALGVSSDAPSFDTQVYNTLRRMCIESGLIRRDGRRWVWNESAEVSADLLEASNS